MAPCITIDRVMTLTEAIMFSPIKLMIGDNDITSLGVLIGLTGLAGLIIIIMQRLAVRLTPIIIFLSYSGKRRFLLYI